MRSRTAARSISSPGAFRARRSASPEGNSARMTDRDLFPEIVRLAAQCQRAVFIENVRGLLDPVFDSYHGEIAPDTSSRLGLEPMGFRLLNASDFGVRN